jgi:hypothetical protein
MISKNRNSILRSFPLTGFVSSPSRPTSTQSHYSDIYPRIPMSTSLPTFDPSQVARDTASLLGPQVAAWQFSLVLYGMLTILHANYIRSPSYTSHSNGIKSTIWTVFALVSVYTVMVCINTFHWMSKFLQLIVATDCRALN